MLDTMNSTVKSPRRWKLQFSLRTLMLLMLLVCLPLSWLSFEIQQAAKQRKATVKIREIGGTAMHCHLLEPQDDWADRCPKWLQKTLGDDLLVTINYVSFRKDIGDQELTPLRSLPQLRALHLNGGRITDDGLVHLDSLSQLESLTMKGPNITDCGLLHLVKLSTLKKLDLSSTKITDAGLATLCRLSRLEALDLSGTQITDAGIDEFRKAMPNVDITR